MIACVPGAPHEKDDLAQIEDSGAACHPRPIEDDRLGTAG